MDDGHIIFAGQAELTKGMLEAGLMAKAFDIAYSGDSLASAACFRWWLLSLCWTVPNADQWHGIVCSSWVFMSRQQTKRQLNVNVPVRIWGDRRRERGARQRAREEGQRAAAEREKGGDIERDEGERDTSDMHGPTDQDETRQLVADGNDFAIKVAGMCSIGWLNEINFSIEQPVSSLLGYFPCMSRLFVHTQVEVTNTYLGNFGAASQKPVKFWHTSGWVRELKTSKPATSTGFTKLVHKGPNGRVTGIRREMKESQAYPPRFGAAAAAARRRHGASPPTKAA